MIDKKNRKKNSGAKALCINRNTLKQKIDAMKIEVKKYKNNE
jgi:two-component system nitrogen regulation response regulator GlnG